MEVIGSKVNPGVGEVDIGSVLVSVLFLIIGIFSIFTGVRRHLLIKRKG